MNHLTNILLPLSYLSKINVSLNDKLNNFLFLIEYLFWVHEQGQFSKIFDNYIITDY
jgi:hypothetical protein